MTPSALHQEGFRHPSWWRLFIAVAAGTVAGALLGRIGFDWSLLHAIVFGLFIAVISGTTVWWGANSPVPPPSQDGGSDSRQG